VTDDLIEAAGVAHPAAAVAELGVEPSSRCAESSHRAPLHIDVPQYIDRHRCVSSGAQRREIDRDASGARECAEMAEGSDPIASDRLDVGWAELGAGRWEAARAFFEKAVADESFPRPWRG
jgi:hypothetical protein